MITASDERTDRLTRLRAVAYRIRRHALDMAEVQGQGYIGQALGVADVLAVLYADQLRFRPEDPDWPERDRFLLSTGHYAIALYAALAEAGIIGEDELQTYGTDGSRLPISSRGRDVFISTGLMTMRALSAAARLEQDRIDVAVLHAPTIKPLDREAIRSAADPDRLMITLENHTVVGGLGEAVAATVAYAGLSRRMLPIGLPDEFLAAGALPTLHDRYGLSTEAVIARVKAELSGSGESALPTAGS